MEYLIWLWPAAGIAIVLYRLHGQDTWPSLLSDPQVYFLLGLSTLVGPFTWLALRDTKD